MTAREAFPGVEETGADHYSIHPLFPISDKIRCLAGTTGCFFLPGGPWPSPGLVGGYLGRSGRHGAENPQRGKAAYHAACAIASNLVCALVKKSVDLLAGCGFFPAGGPVRPGPPDGGQPGASDPGRAPGGPHRSCGAGETRPPWPSIWPACQGAAAGSCTERPPEGWCSWQRKSIRTLITVP